MLNFPHQTWLTFWGTVTPTHTRPEHPTPTIALFGEMTSIDACNADDHDRLPTLFSDLVEFYCSNRIFERSHLTEELVSLLSDELDPRDFSLSF